ncbi:MAG: excinuclease ABC subunit C, partial [Planctomycetota bacterium]
QKVVIKVPQKGQKRKLVNLALKNCRCSFQNLKKREDQTLELLSKTQNLLGLKSLPWRIECFDISNIQGAYSVGSKVCFEMAEPLKEEYRKYKIKHFTSPNDFGMMEEVLYRRFQRGLLEGDLPDLVMVDGGKGQLGVAQKVFDQLSIQGIDLIGIAKARKPGEKEKIFFPDREKPLILPPHEPVLHLLQRVRDEAHRFAIEYHRNLRDRDFLRNKGSSGKVP